MAELFRYAAFISYSSKDRAFAQKVHRALESYRIPAALGAFDLIGGGKKNRIFPVFLDREELPSGELGEAIESALKAANALIIVCSPNAAASPWVNKEIETFLSFGRRNRIFAIIAPDAPLLDANGNDATLESFPPAFRGEGLADGAAGFEPLAGDARKGKDGFRKAWLKVVAGLIDVNFGKLEDRDKKARASQRTRWTAGISSVALFAAYAGGATMTQFWRTELYGGANRMSAEGRPADATALALGALPAPFAVSPWRADGADSLSQGLGAAKIIADLGPLWAFTLSDNGAILAIWRCDAQGTGAAIDLQTGAKTELGPLGLLRNFTLSENGAILAIQREDAQRTAAVLDLQTGAKTELGPLGPLQAFTLSGNGAILAIQREDAQGTGAVIDLKTGVKTEFGSLGPLRAFTLSGNGAILVIQRRDAQGTGAAIDLQTGAKTELGSLLNFTLSGNGAILAIRRGDAKQTGAVYDLKTGAKTELGPLMAFTLSANGAILAIRRDDAQATGAVYDLKTGAKTELGPLWNFTLSDNGGTLAIYRRDAQRTGAVFDLKTGTKTELGPLGPVRDFTLSDNGATLAIHRVGVQQTGAVYDLKTGAKTELGPLNELTLSDGGATLAIQRDDAQYTGAVFDLQTGAKTELGPLGPLWRFALSDNGATLAIQRDDKQTTGAVFDLTHPVNVSGKGAALRTAICNANGHALRPLPRVLGSAEEEAEARETQAPRDAALAGRPWNPCDWRGLLAIFPSKERGDALFEGPRQWLKLMRVRWLGETDYACTDSTFGTHEEAAKPKGNEAAIKRLADRANMCALYATPREEKAPPSP